MSCHALLAASRRLRRASLGMLVLWIAGVAYVKQKGLLLQRPADPSLLRNMVYFPKLRQ